MRPGGYGSAAGGRQPVKRGPRLLVVRTTKCVRSTICVVVAPEMGSSKGPDTGGCGTCAL